MAAKRTRAAGKLVNDSCGGATPSKKGKRERTQRSLAFPKQVRELLHRGGPPARHSLKNTGLFVPRHADIATWSGVRLSTVVSHILSEHHRFTFLRINRLERLLGQVVDQHARDHPQLVELQVLFLALSDKLTSHMIREEQMLFPYILRLEEAAEHGERLARPVFGSVRDPIDVLMVEHEGMKASLEKMRVAGDNYVVPPEGSAGWRALARGLTSLEQDLHRHLQIEDKVLFPRAVSAENSDRYLVGV